MAMQSTSVETPKLWGRFDSIKDHLFNQYTELEFDPDTGLSLDELEAEEPEVKDISQPEPREEPGLPGEEMSEPEAESEEESGSKFLDKDNGAIDVSQWRESLYGSTDDLVNDASPGVQHQTPSQKNSCVESQNDRKIKCHAEDAFPTHVLTEHHGQE